MRNFILDGSEAQEQELLFNWVNWNMQRIPELKLLHHVPNGGSRDKREAVNLKRQGVRAGVPDLALPVARGGYHGMYIEMKVGKNRPTEKQQEWLAALWQQGYYTTVCYSWRAAADTITNYIDGKIVREAKQ